MSHILNLISEITHTFEFGRYYRDYSRYLNDELSSGSILISNNAQAMPKIGVVSNKS